jgi:broad specificity phosphatase PhoE
VVLLKPSAQRRIVGTVEKVLTASAGYSGDIAIVAHGGVGTLLLCHLRGDVIGRQHDQPHNNGGNYFAFDATTCRLHRGWRAIDA